MEPRVQRIWYPTWTVGGMGKSVERMRMIMPVVRVTVTVSECLVAWRANHGRLLQVESA